MLLNSVVQAEFVFSQQAGSKPCPFPVLVVAVAGLILIHLCLLSLRQGLLLLQLTYFRTDPSSFILLASTAFSCKELCACQCVKDLPCVE